MSRNRTARKAVSGGRGLSRVAAFSVGRPGGMAVFVVLAIIVIVSLGAFALHFRRITAGHQHQLAEGAVKARYAAESAVIFVYHRMKNGTKTEFFEGNLWRELQNGVAVPTDEHNVSSHVKASRTENGIVLTGTGTIRYGTNRRLRRSVNALATGTESYEIAAAGTSGAYRVVRVNWNLRWAGAAGLTESETKP